MSSPSSADAGRSGTGPAASRSSARPARSVVRPSTSSMRIRRPSGSSRSRPARTPACWPSRPRAFDPPRSRSAMAPGCAGLDLPPGTERVGGADALERAGDPRRRRPRRGRHGRRREPPAGPRRAAGRQGRGDRQQGDARRRWPPGDAARPRAGRGAGRPPSGRSVCQPAGLAAPDRLGALRDLAVPRRRVDGERRRADPDRVRRSVPRRGRGRRSSP